MDQTVPLIRVVHRGLVVPLALGTFAMFEVGSTDHLEMPFLIKFLLDGR